MPRQGNLRKRAPDQLQSSGELWEELSDLAELDGEVQEVSNPDNHNAMSPLEASLFDRWTPWCSGLPLDRGTP